MAVLAARTLLSILLFLLLLLLILLLLPLLLPLLLFPPLPLMTMAASRPGSSRAPPWPQPTILAAALACPWLMLLSCSGCEMGEGIREERVST